MRVVGTAGHVDHGKSTLVQALTGIDPDRLQEEKDRQMTIDLGFAWMTLPSGEGLGFVDVPGHRDFIENMLAGIGGIDAALLVIGADEGIMPQTREHLAILDLLEIDSLIVAHSRIDLISEPDWIALVEEDTRALLGSTRFDAAPMVRVSPITGEGMAELVELLDTTLERAAPKTDSDRPRLPIDRAFTIAGFGTVVTGTLLDGALEKGQEVELLPKGVRARIRGLQTHKAEVELAEPGSRVAANLTGLSVEQIERGDVLAWPGTDEPSRMLDVQFRVLADSAVPIRHNMSVKFFTGSSQRMARVRLLHESPLQGGDDGWLQLELENSVAVRRADHFILRQPSPGATLGGGRIADPHPMRRHKRRDPAVIHELERLASGEPSQVFMASLSGQVPVRVRDAAREAGLSEEEAAERLLQMQSSGDLVLLNESDQRQNWIALSAKAWERQLDRATSQLRAYHADHPLRGGMPIEEFRSKAGTELVEAFIARGVVIRKSNRVRLPDFQVEHSPEQERRLQGLLDRFAENPYRPPTWKESVQAVGAELLEGLIEADELVKVSEGVLFSREAFDHMKVTVIKVLQSNGEITIADVRDMFETSRKYALALMENLDSMGVTYRDGDVRRLVHGG